MITEEFFCHSNSRERSSATIDVKNSQGVPTNTWIFWWLTPSNK